MFYFNRTFIWNKIILLQIKLSNIVRNWENSGGQLHLNIIKDKASFPVTWFGMRRRGQWTSNQWLQTMRFTNAHVTSNYKIIVLLVSYDSCVIPSILQPLVTSYHLKWHNSVCLVQVSVQGTFGVGHYELLQWLKFRQLSFTL